MEVFQLFIRIRSLVLIVIYTLAFCICFSVNLGNSASLQSKFNRITNDYTPELPIDSFVTNDWSKVYSPKSKNEPILQTFFTIRSSESDLSEEKNTRSNYLMPQKLFSHQEPQTSKLIMEEIKQNEKLTESEELNKETNANNKFVLNKIQPNTIDKFIQINYNLSDSQKTKGITLAKFDFDYVSTPFIVSLWIMIVGVAKIVFHVTPKLRQVCPESVVLMVLGVIIGIFFFYSVKLGNEDNLTFSRNKADDIIRPLTPTLFFMYMMPPIVMDAGYHMPNRLFFDNLGSICLYAVLGTVWNTLSIGGALYMCSKWHLLNVELPLLDVLLFSTIISAVDPVAVLAVFEEVHVNEVLYILVFGESLLNDAVTVVLYHMFEGYSELGLDNLRLIDYLMGFLSFFVIAVGGTLMGVLWGFATAFVSRFTHHVKIIEPIFVFVMAYLSYLSAEMFHLSGILSLTFCGITMKNYVEENITDSSLITLKYAMKMLANAAESIIFLFLGVCTVNDSHHWDTLFVILTIFFCLIFRAIGVIFFTALANKFRIHKISAIEQFIMSYGGLRGAVAFALVLVVNKKIIHAKDMMVTTVIALVYFTVFLQGITVGPLVNILKVPRSNKYELTMNERIHTRLMDHLMAGIEDITGMMVGNYKLRDKFRRYNNTYLKYWFLRNSQDSHNTTRKIFETHSRLNLEDALNIVNKQNLLDFYQRRDNMLAANKNFSSLFRSYTQANLTSIQKESYIKQLPGLNMSLTSSSEFNFDLGNLEYSLSHKDLADSEVHHLLDDSMFMPLRRYRKYSKCDLPDQPLHRQSKRFQHQLRTNVRHMIHLGELRRRSKRKRQLTELRNLSDPSIGRKSNENYSNKLRLRYNYDNHVHGHTYPTAPGTTSILKPEVKWIKLHKNDSKLENEDYGITFTAKSKPPVDPKRSNAKTATNRISNPQLVQESNNDVAAEESLPWRRNSTNTAPIKHELKDEQQLEPYRKSNQFSLIDQVSKPLKQEEFAPWIRNKDYLQDYYSPTNTLLKRNDHFYRNSLPAVYDIFSHSCANKNKTNLKSLNLPKTILENGFHPVDKDDFDKENSDENEKETRLNDAEL